MCDLEPLEPQVDERQTISGSIIGCAMCCTLRSFCGMKLSTAGLSIGWISFAFSLIETISSIVVISCLTGVMTMILTLSPSDRHFEPSIAFGISVLVSVQLGFALLDLAASVLLILGTIKRMHLMLLPWLIHNGTILVIKFLIITIGMIANLTMYGPPFPVWLGISFILGIWVWLWFGVHSLYKTIRTERDASGVDYELFPKGVNTADTESEHGTLISVNHLLRSQI